MFILVKTQNKNLLKLVEKSISQDGYRHTPSLKIVLFILESGKGCRRKEIGENRDGSRLFFMGATKEKSDIKQQDIKCLSQGSKYFVVKTSA